VLTWEDEAAMIEAANDVPYGLTASVWTNDVSTAHETAEAMEAGFVWVNQAGPHYLGAPFGGWKQSGTGNQSAMEEAYEFTQTKNVNVKL
jgi:betaine-aldehyde dehydrogenase